MDFSVRQARDCLEGDMVVIRFASSSSHCKDSTIVSKPGSCDTLIDEPIGTALAPSSYIAVNRSVDFDLIRIIPRL